MPRPAPLSGCCVGLRPDVDDVRRAVQLASGMAGAAALAGALGCAPDPAPRPPDPARIVQAAGRGPMVYQGYAKQLAPGEAAPPAPAAEALVRGRSCRPLAGAWLTATKPDGDGQVWLLTQPSGPDATLLRFSWVDQARLAASGTLRDAAAAVDGSVVFLSEAATPAGLAAPPTPTAGAGTLAAAGRRPPSAKRAALAGLRQRPPQRPLRSLSALRPEGTTLLLSMPDQHVTSFAVQGETVWYTALAADATASTATEVWRRGLDSATPTHVALASAVADAGGIARVWGQLDRWLLVNTAGSAPALLALQLAGSEVLVLGPPAEAATLETSVVWWRTEQAQTWHWNSQTPAALAVEATGATLLTAGLPALVRPAADDSGVCPDGLTALAWLDDGATLQALQWCHQAFDGDRLLAAWPYAANAELTMLTAVIERAVPPPEPASWPAGWFGPPLLPAPQLEVCLYPRTAAPLRRL